MALITSDDLLDEKIVWRYLSLTKFIDLMNRNSSYFCQASLMPDKYDMALFPETEKYLEQKNILIRLIGLHVGMIAALNCVNAHI
ncbi:MAG: hypothetical protein DI626_02440 [Micavibrio aeruginosavorus]|uniref:Uncharacterized protein n=1 Tax=Micavibrio aeruginosavorus TaxID=349221 RepID=A0A2W5A6R4_9BACT|nr:MAG: hypothetical protein DI626_02440 [Micavibrio aeruginosavorus]